MKNRQIDRERQTSRQMTDRHKIATSEVLVFFYFFLKKNIDNLSVKNRLKIIMEIGRAHV